MLPFRLRYADQIVAGFLFTAALVLALALFFILKSQDLFTKRVEYWTTFDDGGGVKAETPVKISGIEVGKVKRVELNDDNRVKVTFEILEMYTSRVLGDGIITDCEATPELMKQCGSRVEASVPAGLGAFLPTGGGLNIVVGHKGNPPVEPGGFVASVKQEGFNEFLTRLQNEDFVKNAQEIVANVSLLLTRINDVQGPIWQSVQNVQVVTDRARKGQGVVGEAFMPESKLQQQVREALATLERSLANVEQSSQDINVATGSVKGKLDEIDRFVDNLERFSRDATAVGEKMNAFADESEKVPPDVRAAVKNLDARIDDLGAVLKGLKKTWPFSLGVEDKPAAPAPPK